MHRYHWAIWLISAGLAGGLVGCHHDRLKPACPTYPPPPPLACPLVPAGPACEAQVLDPDGAAEPGAHLPLQPQLIDLPSALQLANTQSPEIAVARERIREALAIQDRADLLWLPDLQYGPAWMRHDGQIQRANGEVFTVSRSSLWIGGGPALNLNTAEAIYAPLVTRQFTAARSAGATSVANDWLLDVALAYTDLLQVYAELQINQETLENARHLLDITQEHEKAGTGVAADTARSQAEASFRESERIELEGRAAVASARLVQLLNLSSLILLRPVEPAIVPIALIPEAAPLSELVAQALTGRPELAENQALIGATVERWRASKVAPLIPNLQLTFGAGGFGGGPNSFFGNFDGRSDFAAMAVWNLNSLGLGNLALTRQRYSEYSQAMFRQNAIEAKVAQQVVTAFSVAYARRRELVAAQRAVVAARLSYRLNEERIRRAPQQGRPIELLQAIQALARARQEYLRTVADYNRAQFRLYTALGAPSLCALDQMVPVPVKEPTVPSKPDLPSPRAVPEKEP